MYWRTCAFSFTLEGKKGVVEAVATITARFWFVRRVGSLGVIEGHRIEREEQLLGVKEFLAPASHIFI